MNTHPSETMACSSCDSHDFQGSLHRGRSVCLCVWCVSGPVILFHQLDCELKVEHKSFSPQKPVKSKDSAMLCVCVCVCVSPEDLLCFLYGKRVGH